MKSLFFLVAAALLGSGLMAGLFFAFSVAVMPALGKLQAEKGMAGMQSINAAILNPVFLAVFMVTALICACTLVCAMLNWSLPASRYLLAGSFCYLVGVLVVTMVVNVPMNDALAAAKPSTAEGVQLWAGYLARWTAWNHVRTVAAALATTSFALGLRFY